MALNDTDSDRRLDRAYGAAARDEPPAHLDAAILAAAHREAGARPRTLASRLRRWRVPVSLAAMVVVSVSLVTLVREEGGDQLMEPGVPASRGLEPAAPAPPPESGASGPPRLPEPESAAPREWRNAPEARADRADRDPASGPSALGDTASPGKATADRPVRAPDPEGALPAERALAKRPEEPSLAARAAGKQEESRAAAESPGGPPAREAQRPAPALSRMESQARDRAGSEDPAAGVAAPAPRAAPAPAAQAPRGPRLQSRPVDPMKPELAGLLKEYDSRPPRDWIARIQELKRGGQAGLAEDMLAEFRRRYPGHPLPTDLE